MPKIAPRLFSCPQMAKFAPVDNKFLYCYTLLSSKIKGDISLKLAKLSLNIKFQFKLKIWILLFGFCLLFIMAFNEIQQINHFLQEKKRILITFRKDAPGDAVSAAVALWQFLEKINKSADIVCDGFNLPNKLKFLKNANIIKPIFSHLQKFILSLDVEKTGIEELSYDVKDNKLQIFITPKQGFITRSDINTAQSDFKYDLIITLNTPDLESLGQIYDNNVEMFYKTPIINIDFAPDNEHYGQINFVDITASSVSEVVYNLFTKIGNEYINAEIATSLLAGMIISTHSFKSEKVKPTTMSTAGKLISLGGDRETIVQNLYHTRNLATLKLWGYALNHLQSEKQIGLIWSTLTREDFVRTGAQETDLYEIIDELIINSPNVEIVFILHEQKDDLNKIHGIIKSYKGINVKDLFGPYSPHGDATSITFTITDKTLKEAEEEILNIIKKRIDNK